MTIQRFATVIFFIFSVNSISYSQCQFTVHHANTDDHCLYALEDIVWERSSVSAELTPSGNGITKSGGTGGTNPRARSVNSVKNNGWATTTINQLATARRFGLSELGNVPIQYAFSIRGDNTLDIIENGSVVRSLGLAYPVVLNMVLRISRENNVIRYYIDNTLVHISALTPTVGQPLFVDVSLNTVGSNLQNIVVANGSNGSFIATAPPADLGTGPGYQWFLDGAPVGTGQNYTNSSLAPGSQLTCELTPGAGGCSAGTVTSNTVRFQMRPLSSLGDYYISNTPAASACLSAEEDVIGFQNRVNVAVSGNSVSKNYGNTSTVDAGASSVRTVVNNGYAEVTIAETNRGRYFGLSSTDPNINWNSIEFAYYFRSDGIVEIYQSGVSAPGFGSSTAYVSGDVYRIAVDDGVVKYYRIRSGTTTLLYISGITPTLPLRVDMSFQDLGGTLNNIKIANGSTTNFTVNSPITGASPSYQWTLNGIPDATGPTYFNPALAASDQVRCEINPDLVGCLMTTQPITLSARNFGGTFYINNTPTNVACALTVEQVQFTNKVGVTSTTNNLTKVQGGNGFYNAGATSLNQIFDNGYAETTISETNTSRVFGISTNPTTRPVTGTSSAEDRIQYGFRFEGNATVWIYERNALDNGWTHTGFYNNYAPGEVYRILVDNGVVRYYRNGTLLRSATLAPVTPLVVDVSLNSMNATLNNVVVSNVSTGVFSAVTAGAGPSPTYQWRLNGAPVGSNAPTYASSTLAVNDIVTCSIIPDVPGCTTPENSNSVRVAIVGGPSSPTTTWTGTSSTAWETSTNWTNGKPNGFTNVVIPMGTPVPVINQTAGAYNITINSGASLSIAGSNNLTIFNRLTNNGTLIENTSTVNLQNCTNNRNEIVAVSETFNNLTINNSFGVDVTGTHAIKNTLTLVSGIVSAPTASDLIVLNDNATVTGASNSSHVNGRVRKIGDDAFTFPVGNSGIYRPISISAPSTITDHFTAQYYRAAQGYGGRSTWDSGIWHVSGCEYWTIQRSGSSSPNVTLSWNDYTGCPNPPYISNMADLFVAYWDGSNWKSAGHGGASGDNNNGTIQNFDPIADYIAMTLGTVSPDNVLPIELGDFVARKNSLGAKLVWETLSEKNSSYFDIERAGDDLKFHKIGSVHAKGDSKDPIEYNYLDQSVGTGNVYYRLKLIDIDGSFVYSKIESLQFSNSQSFQVYPNPANRGELVNLFPQPESFQVFEIVKGKMIYEGSGSSPLNTTQLPAGVYLITLTDGSKTRLVIL
jgi:hypothetical protein